MRKDPRDITRSHTTLTSLPSEILTQICLLGSRSTACSLARVAPRFAAAAKPRLWRDLDLTLHPHYAEMPTVYPFPSGTTAYKDWEKAEEQDVECRRRVALREKVKAVQVLAKGRTCRLVEGVRVTTRPGAMYETLQVLEAVSPFVRTMEIGVCQEEAQISPGQYPIQDQTILTSITSAGWSLISLTHLHLGRRAILFDNLFNLLGRLPLLRSLHLHIAVDPSDIHIQYATPTHTSAISELFIACDYGSHQGLVVQRMSTLLEYTRAVKRIALDSEPSDEQGIEEITRALAAMPELEDLAWSVDTGKFEAAVRWAVGQYEDDRRIANGVFTSLRRLLLREGEIGRHGGMPVPWSAMQMCNFARIPSLEAIFLTVAPSLFVHPPATTLSKRSSRTHDLIEDSFMDFTTMPQLRVLHTVQVPLAPTDPQIFDRLDEMESPESSNGQINSVVHDGEILLWAWFYLQGTEIADHAYDDTVEDLPVGLSCRYYETRNREQRQKVYYRQTEATWQAFTSFRGEMVPMHIINKLRIAEGKSEAEWRGRGIEVGDAAWEVLTEWHDFVFGDEDE